MEKPPRNQRNHDIFSSGQNTLDRPAAIPA
jgi:hypothetical protein